MKVFHHTAKLYVLKSDTFTLVALDAVHILAMVHEMSLTVHFHLLAGNDIHIVQFEIGGNNDIMSAVLHTIHAVCAWDNVLFTISVYTFQHALFFSAQRLKILHVRDVVYYLLHIAHTA